MPKPTTDLPETQVLAEVAHERAQRRRFSAEEKLRILQDADECHERGELTALLRRERIYSSQLTDWRCQRDAGALVGLTNAKVGRKAQRDAKDREIGRLRREKAKLEDELRLANDLLGLQKKALSLLDQLKGRETT